MIAANQTCFGAVAGSAMSTARQRAAQPDSAPSGRPEGPERQRADACRQTATGGAQLDRYSADEPSPCPTSEAPKPSPSVPPRPVPAELRALTRCDWRAVGDMWVLNLEDPVADAGEVLDEFRAFRPDAASLPEKAQALRASIDSVRESSKGRLSPALAEELRCASNALLEQEKTARTRAAEGLLSEFRDIDAEGLDLPETFQKLRERVDSARASGEAIVDRPLTERLQKASEALRHKECIARICEERGRMAFAEAVRYSSALGPELWRPRERLGETLWSMPLSEESGVAEARLQLWRLVRLPSNMLAEALDSDRTREAVIAFTHAATTAWREPHGDASASAADPGASGPSASTRDGFRAACNRVLVDLLVQGTGMSERAAREKLGLDLHGDAVAAPTAPAVRFARGHIAGTLPPQYVGAVEMALHSTCDGVYAMVGLGVILRASRLSQEHRDALIAVLSRLPVYDEGRLGHDVGKRDVIAFLDKHREHNGLRAHEVDELRGLPVGTFFRALAAGTILASHTLGVGRAVHNAARQRFDRSDFATVHDGVPAKTAVEALARALGVRITFEKENREGARGSTTHHGDDAYWADIPVMVRPRKEGVLCGLLERSPEVDDGSRASLLAGSNEPRVWSDAARPPTCDNWGDIATATDTRANPWEPKVMAAEALKTLFANPRQSGLERVVNKLRALRLDEANPDLRRRRDRLAESLQCLQSLNETHPGLRQQLAQRIAEPPLCNDIEALLASRTPSAPFTGRYGPLYALANQLGIELSIVIPRRGEGGQAHTYTLGAGPLRVHARWGGPESSDGPQRFYYGSDEAAVLAAALEDWELSRTTV